MGSEDKTFYTICFILPGLTLHANPPAAFAAVLTLVAGVSFLSATIDSPGAGRALLSAIREFAGVTTSMLIA